ncbi:MAG: Rrf2 family transcriptional regulator [Candidatus Omnitrophica bacterium]|nr:Rrf2 family transcriptional regulator [Candidatus Omnitrophota bacterium]
MKLSTRSTYGLRALVELGLANGRGPISAALIASKQELSVAYLEQLLHRLKQEQVVTSIRGPKGGYCLSRQPEQITVAEIVHVLDGAAARRNGKGKKDGRRSSSVGVAHTGRHAQHITHAVFRCVHERLAEALHRVTLQDLCDEAREQPEEPLEHRYVFHI